jgi:hypothetical protein
MKIRRCACVLILVGPLSGLVSCGSGEESWFEQSKALDQRKDNYIQQQIEAGMPPDQARKAWGLQYSIEQTHGMVDSPAGTSIEFKK